LDKSGDIKFNLTKSNVLEIRTTKNSQVNPNSINQSLDNISENHKENSQNITNLEIEKHSESKQDIKVMSQIQNDTDLYQLDFDQMSSRWITHENSRIKELMDTNNFSCIKSSLGQENIKNFFEESKYDSFFRQITNIEENSTLRDKL
jgi:hypothetical protein